MTDEQQKSESSTPASENNSNTPPGNIDPAPVIGDMDPILLYPNLPQERAAEVKDEVLDNLTKREKRISRMVDHSAEAYENADENSMWMLRDLAFQIYTDTLSRTAATLSRDDTQYPNAEAIAQKAHSVAAATTREALSMGRKAMVTIMREYHSENIVDMKVEALRIRSAIERHEANKAKEAEE